MLSSVTTNLSKRLMVTFLCTLTAGFFYNIIAMVIAIIFALTFGVQNGGSLAVFIMI